MPESFGRQCGTGSEDRTCSRIPSGNDWSCSSQPGVRGFHGPASSFLKKFPFDRPSRRLDEEAFAFGFEEELFDSLPLLSRPPNIQPRQARATN